MLSCGEKKEGLEIDVLEKGGVEDVDWCDCFLIHGYATLGDFLFEFRDVL